VSPLVQAARVYTHRRHLLLLLSPKADIKFDVIMSLCLSIGPETDISATVQLIGVKFCMMVELCPGRVFSHFGGNIFMGLQMRGQNVFGQFVRHNVEPFCHKQDASMHRNSAAFVYSTIRTTHTRYNLYWTVEMFMARDGPTVQQ